MSRAYSCSAASASLRKPELLDVAIPLERETRIDTNHTAIGRSRHRLATALDIARFLRLRRKACSIVGFHSGQQFRSQLKLKRNSRLFGDRRMTIVPTTSQVG